MLVTFRVRGRGLDLEVEDRVPDVAVRSDEHDGAPHRVDARGEPALRAGKRHRSVPAASEAVVVRARPPAHDELELRARRAAACARLLVAVDPDREYVAADELRSISELGGKRHVFVAGRAHARRGHGEEA